MNRNDRPVINPVTVLREEFDDWALLFNPDTGVAVGINPVGVEVWKLMDGNRDITSILAAVEDHFSGVPEGVAGEVMIFLENLEKRGFLNIESIDKSS